MENGFSRSYTKCVRCRRSWIAENTFLEHNETVLNVTLARNPWLMHIHYSNMLNELLPKRTNSSDKQDSNIQAHGNKTSFHSKAVSLRLFYETGLDWNPFIQAFIPIFKDRSDCRITQRIFLNGEAFPFTFMTFLACQKLRG